MALIEATFRSFTLKRAVTFSALIPADTEERAGRYGQSDIKKFKTLYMLHGYTGNHRDFIQLSDISRYVETLGLAVIFPSGENSFYLEDDELETSHSAYVGQELLEFTRCIFPLSDKREDTFIGGLSMGAYGAVINALRYPEVFSRVIAMSGAFIEMEIADTKSAIPIDFLSNAAQKRIFGDFDTLRQSDKDPRFLIEKLETSGKPVPEIFLTCGSGDFLVSGNRQLHNYLQGRNIGHTYNEDNGTHDWDYWHKHLYRCMERLLKEDSR